MTEQREYLVALAVRSTLHTWIAAASEQTAIEAAQDLYGKDDGAFTTANGESVVGAVVLESRAVKPPAPPKRFAIAFEQPVVHRIVVEAAELDEAIDKAEQLYADEDAFFTFDPPGEWYRIINDWDLVEAEEVQS
jgi:hypothetical protein